MHRFVGLLGMLCFFSQQAFARNTYSNASYGNCRQWQIEKNCTNAKLVARVPFMYINNRIILTLSVNHNKRRLHFLFDTGADGLGIKKSVAAEMGIVATRQVFGSAVGGIVEMGLADSVTLHVGALAVGNNTAAVLPYLDDSLDGIVGGNFLNAYITEIDFDKSEIRLYTFGKFNYLPNQVFIPLDFSRGIPGISCQVTLNNGKVLDGDFHFDTGAGYPLIIFGPSVYRNELTDNFRVDFRSGNTSLGYQSITLNGEFTAAKFGPWALPPFTGSLQMYRDGDESWSPGGDGSFGIEFINRFNWVIDINEHTFAATPNKNFNLPTSFWMKGVEWQFVNGKMFVKRTMPGSLAAKNLFAGDEVMAINGIKFRKLFDKANLKKYRMAWEPKEIGVVVRRQGKKYRVCIP